MGMTAAVGMMGAGAGFSAMSSRNAGKANQKIADYNADVAEMQALDAVARGQLDEADHRLRVRGVIGSQRAAFAAAGVDVNSGNAVDVQADTAKFGELDALTIRANAAREAWGYKVGAQDMRMRGQLARQEGNSKAVGSIITGAGSYASNRWGFGSTSRRG